jgi:hypothetical protein
MRPASRARRVSTRGDSCVDYRSQGTWTAAAVLATDWRIGGSSRTSGRRRVNPESTESMTRMLAALASKCGARAE